MTVQIDNDGIAVESLYVGLTRPATMWGVPYVAFVIEFMLTTLIFLAVGNPLYLLLAIPIHGILYLISANDAGIFSSMFLWVKTIGRSRVRNFWGAASFSPTPPQKWKE